VLAYLQSTRQQHKVEFPALGGALISTAHALCPRLLVPGHMKRSGRINASTCLSLPRPWSSQGALGPSSPSILDTYNPNERHHRGIRSHACHHQPQRPASKPLRKAQPVPPSTHIHTLTPRLTSASTPGSCPLYCRLLPPPTAHHTLLPPQRQVFALPAAAAATQRLLRLSLGFASSKTSSSSVGNSGVFEIKPPTYRLRRLWPSSRRFAVSRALERRLTSPPITLTILSGCRALEHTLQRICESRTLRLGGQRPGACPPLHCLLHQTYQVRQIPSGLALLLVSSALGALLVFGSSRPLTIRE